MWKDKMIQACFWSTLLYSICYPFIHKFLMKEVTEKMLSANQIVLCLSVIVVNNIWNKKSDKLYGFMPALLAAEVIVYVVAHALVIFGLLGAAGYYIADTILFATITRNIICAGNKLKSKTYKGDDREEYDNTVTIACSVGTLLGSGVALMFDIPIWICFVISTVGMSVDNVFYYFAYREVEE